MPAAIPVIEVVAGVVGTAVTVYSAVRAGQQQKAADKYNSEIAQQNAQIAKQQGAEAAAQQRRKTAQLVGAEQAAYGASGVDGTSGSALDVLTDSVRQGTLNSLNAQYGYTLRAAGATDNANLDLTAGNNASASGIMNAAGDLMSGAGRTAQTYEKYNPPSDNTVD